MLAVFWRIDWYANMIFGTALFWNFMFCFIIWDCYNVRTGDKSTTLISRYISFWRESVQNFLKLYCLPSTIKPLQRTKAFCWKELMIHPEPCPFFESDQLQTQMELFFNVYHSAWWRSSIRSSWERTQDSNHFTFAYDWTKTKIDNYHHHGTQHVERE